MGARGGAAVAIIIQKDASSGKHTNCLI
jgi:hypothetical protein